MDWETVLAGGVGAGGAIAAVALTQRSERSRTHADRVWQKRTEIYVRTYQWASDFYNLFGDQSILAVMKKPVPEPSPLNESDQVLLEIYGSKAVINALRECNSTIVAELNPSELAGMADKDYKIRNSLRKLMKAITAETSYD